MNKTELSKTIKSNTIERLLNSRIVKITGSILAIIGTSVTIYAAFFQEKHSNLQYIVTNSTNVLDVNADVSKLDILFDGVSIKEKKENIRIINVKIINSGNKDITIDYYDENDPIGIKISQGYLIDKPELISTSSNYLERNLKGKIVSDSINVKFPRIILESGESFMLKLMIIHKSIKIPIISSIGKVAGQKEIAIIQISDKKELSFLPKTFQGNALIQITRLLIYTLITLFILIGFVFTADRIKTYRVKKKNENLIKIFKSNDAYCYTRMDDVIFDKYIKYVNWINENDDRFMKSIITLTEDEKKLNQIYNTFLEKEKQLKELQSDHNNMQAYFEFDTSYKKDLNLIDEMIHDGIVFKEGIELKINQKMRHTIILFKEFLRENRENE